MLSSIAVDAAAAAQAQFFRDSYTLLKSEQVWKDLSQRAAKSGSAAAAAPAEALAAQKRDRDAYFRDVATTVVRCLETDSAKRIVNISFEPNSHEQEALVEIVMQMMMSATLGLDAAQMVIVANPKRYIWQEHTLESYCPSCLLPSIVYADKKYAVRISGGASPMQTLRNGLIVMEDIDDYKNVFGTFCNELVESHALHPTTLRDRGNYLVVMRGEFFRQLCFMFGDLWSSKFTATVALTAVPHYRGYRHFGEELVSTVVLKGDAMRDWIEQDILQEYMEEYRIHIIRVGSLSCIQQLRVLCAQNNIHFVEAKDSSERTQRKISSLFTGAELARHVVLVVNKLFRRLNTNSVPVSWLPRIGALHEASGKFCDMSMHLFGLTSLACGTRLPWMRLQTRVNVSRGGTEGGEGQAKDVEEEEDDDDEDYVFGPFRTALPCVAMGVDVWNNPDDARGLPRFTNDEVLAIEVAEPVPKALVEGKGKRTRPKKSDGESKATQVSHLMLLTQEEEEKEQLEEATADDIFGSDSEEDEDDEEYEVKNNGGNDGNDDDDDDDDDSFLVPDDECVDESVDESAEESGAEEDGEDDDDDEDKAGAEDKDETEDENWKVNEDEQDKEGGDAAGFTDRCDVKEVEEPRQPLVADAPRVEPPAMYSGFRVYAKEETLATVCRKLGYLYNKLVPATPSRPFIDASLNGVKGVQELDVALFTLQKYMSKGLKIKTTHKYFACYQDKDDPASIVFVLLLEDCLPETVAAIDSEFPCMTV